MIIIIILTSSIDKQSIPFPLIPFGHSPQEYSVSDNISHLTLE